MPDWLAADPRMAANMESFLATTYPSILADRKEKLEKWQTAAAEAKSKGQQPNPAWPPIQEAPEQPIEFFIGGFYSTHTAMVVPFVFKGMLWDQGEAGVGYGLRGDYDLIFEVMIQNLRKEFGYDLPVVYCQMPKGGAWGPTIHVEKGKSGIELELGELVPLADLPVEPPKPGPVFEGFAKESDPFLRMNGLPLCFMATTRDLQAALHPNDKDEYGARFCMTAMNRVYGRSLESFGPMIASAKRDGGEIRLDFDHVGSGLVALGDKPLQGFYATGAGGKSMWAQSRIEGNQVILSGSGVETADTVSYADTNGGRVLWANLFNKEGLPAFPMTVKVR
jgi:sialate O-acetylesterase